MKILLIAKSNGQQVREIINVALVSEMRPAILDRFPDFRTKVRVMLRIRTPNIWFDFSEDNIPTLKGTVIVKDSAGKHYILLSIEGDVLSSSSGVITDPVQFMYLS